VQTYGKQVSPKAGKVTGDNAIFVVRTIVQYCQRDCECKEISFSNYAVHFNNPESMKNFVLLFSVTLRY